MVWGSLSPTEWAGAWIRVSDPDFGFTHPLAWLERDTVSELRTLSPQAAWGTVTDTLDGDETGVTESFSLEDERRLKGTLWKVVQSATSAALAKRANRSPHDLPFAAWLRYQVH